MNKYTLILFFLGFTFKLFAQPANNNCAGAVDITSLFSSGCATVGAGANPAPHATLPFSSGGATGSGVGTACSGFFGTGDDMWYTWNATQTTLIWQYLNTGDDPGIAIYSGTCGSLTEIDCFSTSSSGVLSGWAIGDQLYIRIFDDFNFFGQSDVSFCLEVPGNSICDANPLTINPGYCDGTNLNGSITNATADGPSLSCWFDNSTENDFWYSVVVPTGITTLTFSTDFGGGSNTDTQLGVYTSSNNSCTGTLTEVACDDDAGTGFLSTTTIPDLAAAGISAGDILFIQVDGYLGTQGTFCLEVTGCGITITGAGKLDESCFEEEDGALSIGVNCVGCSSAADFRFSISPDPNSVSPQTSNLFSNLPPNTYTVTAFNVNNINCDASIIIPIDAADEIMLTASGNNTVCEGADIELTATFTLNGMSTSAVSWAWTGPSFTSSAEDPPPFAATLANSGTYTVVVTDNNNCTNSATVDITVDEMATVDLSSISAELCYKGGETIDLSSDYISGATNDGTWTTSGDGSFNDASNMHPAVTNYTPGTNDLSTSTITLTLTADPNNTCPEASDNITIQIKDVSCTDSNPFDGNN